MIRCKISLFCIPAMLILAACQPMYNNQAKGESSGKLHNEPIYTNDVAFKLHQVIDEFMGVPYKSGGMSAMGMDCSGLVNIVYDKALNVDLGRTTDEQFAKGREVEKPELQYGDLIFFNFTQQEGVSHVGIYVGKHEFVHASTTRGVVKDRLDQKEYAGTFVAAKRVYP